MTIDIRFFNAIFTKAGLEEGYPGGIVAFKADQSVNQEDKHLLALISMSLGELNDLVDAIGAKGVNLDDCCAVAEMSYGPLRPCEAIRIYPIRYQNLDQGWVAEAVSEEERRKVAWTKLEKLLSCGFGPLPMDD
jgi:hypothetical protein